MCFAATLALPARFFARGIMTKDIKEPRVSFEEDKFKKIIGTFLLGWYRAIGGGSPVAFKGYILGILDLTLKDEPVSAGLSANASSHENPARQPNDQGPASHAERPGPPCPDQPASEGQSSSAGNGQSTDAFRTQNGLGQIRSAETGRQAAAQTVPQREPNDIQRAAARKVQQASAKTVFESYRFANGTALGDVWLADLANYEQKSSADAFVARQIRLAFKGHPNCKIKDLSLAAVETIVKRAESEKAA